MRYLINNTYNRKTSTTVCKTAGGILGEGMRFSDELRKRFKEI